MSDNDTPRVVGVSFRAADSVPVAMLKGAGEQAQAVLDGARTGDTVPIVKDSKLVNALYRIPMDTPIGRELFPVMAALIAHVMRIDQVQEQQNP
jgi:type III secretion system FlhB-like substrate exporter